MLNNMFAPPPGLLGDQEDAVRQQMQMQGLLGLAAGLFQAGTPSRTPVSLGGSALQGLAAGQQAAQGTFDQTLKAMQLKQQMDETRRKQAVAAHLREIAPRLITERREPSPVTGGFDAGQGLDVMQGGEGIVPQPRVTGYGINTSVLPALAALGPEGMEYAKNLADFQRLTSPKTSVQSVFDDKGREVKVRYNEDTGEYTPIGGAKAESFVQIDLGNMVELRTPSGNVVGRLAKGASPTAPSYSFNPETGLVTNQRTGVVSVAKDPQGNLIDMTQFRKPSESESKQIIGVQNTRNAIFEFRTELSNFGRLNSLVPTERARIETKYRNMLMQAKEAYNLGVLNGPDLAILEQIIYNPTSMSGIAIGKDAIDAQAGELDRIMANIKTTVQAKGKEVPLLQPNNPFKFTNDIIEGARIEAERRRNQNNRGQ